MNVLLPPLRRHLVASLVFFVAGVAVWSLIWWWSAVQYGAIIDSWIASGRAAGYQIAYDNRRLFGYPFRIVYRFEKLAWKNADGIAFHADDIDISAKPWRWMTFNAKFRGRAEIDVPLDQTSDTLLLAGDDGRARVTIAPDGSWTSSRIRLTHASLGRAPDVLFQADTLQASADKPLFPPKGHNDTGLTLSGEATGVTLPPAMPAPFGPRVQRIAIDLRVMDAVPDFRRKDSLASWNQDSGIVEFDHLRLEWGALRLAAKGTMGFDDELQPEGAFSGTLDHHDEVLRALAKAGFIAPRQEGMLTSALGLFAKPSKTDDISGIEIPITVQLGGLFLGPVQIFAFPDIAWAETPP